MKAACACGQLTATSDEPPVRTSVCHCHACRTRTGSAFSYNARFSQGSISTSGTSSSYTRVGDEGSNITYHFCPTCGVTVWFVNDQVDAVMVPAGAMAPDLPQAPTASVYDDRRPPWLALLADPLEIIN